MRRRDRYVAVDVGILAWLPEEGGGGCWPPFVIIGGSLVF